MTPDQYKKRAMGHLDKLPAELQLALMHAIEWVYSEGYREGLKKRKRKR